MPKQVMVCTAGECNGECYRCRLRACAEERNLYRGAVRSLLLIEATKGGFGPWSYEWNDSWQWLSEQVKDAEELPLDFAPEPSQLAKDQSEYEEQLRLMGGE